MTKAAQRQIIWLRMRAAQRDVELAQEQLRDLEAADPRLPNCVRYLTDAINHRRQAELDWADALQGRKPANTGVGTPWACYNKLLDTNGRK